MARGAWRVARGALRLCCHAGAACWVWWKPVFVLDRTATFKTSYGSVATRLRSVSHSIGTATQHAPSRTDAQIVATFHGLASRWQKPAQPAPDAEASCEPGGDVQHADRRGARAEADLNAIVAAAKTHGSSAAQASAKLVTDILSAKSASTTITQKLGIQ